LPQRSKRDRATSPPHLRRWDGSHPRLELADEWLGQCCVWGGRGDFCPIVFI